MGGRASRQKGLRGEYAVRDYFRLHGWEANRVPSSGAAEGFKGDVEITKDGNKLLVEVKFRQDEFLQIYALLDNSRERVIRLSYGNQQVLASYEFPDLNFGNKTCLLFDGIDKPTRTQKKLFGLIKHVKTCDFLVLKCNHRPLVFVRYWSYVK